MNGWTNRCLSIARKDGGGWDTFEKSKKRVCERGKDLCT